MLASPRGAHRSVSSPLSSGELQPIGSDAVGDALALDPGGGKRKQQKVGSLTLATPAAGIAASVPAAESSKAATSEVVFMFAGLGWTGLIDEDGIRKGIHRKMRLLCIRHTKLGSRRSQSSDISHREPGRSSSFIYNETGMRTRGIRMENPLWLHSRVRVCCSAARNNQCWVSPFMPNRL